MWPGRVQWQLVPWGAVLHDRPHDHVLHHPTQCHHTLLPPSVAGHPSSKPPNPPAFTPAWQAREGQGHRGWHKESPSPLSCPRTTPESCNSFRAATAAPAPLSLTLQDGKGLPPLHVGPNKGAELHFFPDPGQFSPGGKPGRCASETCTLKGIFERLPPQ